MWLCILSFFLAIAIDIVWVVYYKAINNGQAFIAAWLSVAIVICGLFGSWLLIDKEWAALAAYIVGGFIGTYLAVRIGNKNV
jgi:uncharacterized membrane protein